MSKFFKLLIVLFLTTSGYYATRTYHYFFDKHVPTLAVRGLQDGHFYADTIQCCIIGNDPYALDSLSIWIDEKPFMIDHIINKNKLEYEFEINTKNLTNGSHKIKFCVTSAAHTQAKCFREIAFNVDNENIQAKIIHPKTEPKVFQGRTLHLKIQTNKEMQHVFIQTLSTTFTCIADSKMLHTYECFIPIACDEIADEYTLKFEIQDKVGHHLFFDSKFEILSFPFKKQQLKIDAEKIKVEKEESTNNQDLEEELVELLQQSPEKKLWTGPFYAPTEIVSISTDYGTIRTTQEKGRYIHKAVDILNSPRSVVWAPQDGKIVIKNRYPQSGNTVVLDHGCGIFSLFFHLDDFADTICIGKMVKQGNPIGRLGKTGYASGYHLHWEMRINNMAVDPLQWISPNF